MALLEILCFPDNRLRTKAKTVQKISSEHQTMIDNMFKTMYESSGIGLAATQVDIHERIVVIDVSSEKTEPLVLINPKILEKEGQKISEEGCLSVPEIYAEVERAEKIRFSALDRKGNSYEMDAEGLLAICVQHELDHLDGKLFVDYLSRLKRERIRQKLAKAEKNKA